MYVCYIYETKTHAKEIQLLNPIAGNEWIWMFRFSHKILTENNNNLWIKRTNYLKMSNMSICKLWVSIALTCGKECRRILRPNLGPNFIICSKAAQYSCSLLMDRLLNCYARMLVAQYWTVVPIDKAVQVEIRLNQ